MTEEEILNQLEQIIVHSIESTVSKIERPFGVFLSGGVDSGTLAAISKPDIAFTAKFGGGPKYDEFADAKKVAQQLDLKHTVVEPTKEDFDKYFEDAVLALGRTTTHFSLVPLYMLFKRASEMGIKTILMGEGPDEYLAGYTRYTFITHEEKLYDQPELEHWTYAIDTYLGSKISRAARILDEDISTLEPYWDKYDSLLSKIGYCDLSVRGIEDMELKMAERFGVTLLYPYINDELADFCFREVPDSIKIKGFTTKWPMKKVAEKYIPEDVVWRKKKMGGPVAPVGIWLGQEQEFDKTNYVEMQKAVLAK